MILVIEDDPLVAAALDVAIGDLGYPVCLSASTAEAIALAQASANPPTLILSDWRLPEGLTGADAITGVCAVLGCAVPAIILSGETAPERLRAMQAVTDRLLVKPVDLAVLRQALWEVCGPPPQSADATP